MCFQVLAFHAFRSRFPVAILNHRGHGLYEKLSSVDCNRPNSRGCEINLQCRTTRIGKSESHPHFANAEFGDVRLFSRDFDGQSS